MKNYEDKHILLKRHSLLSFEDGKDFSAACRLIGVDPASISIHDRHLILRATAYAEARNGPVSVFSFLSNKGLITFLFFLLVKKSPELLTVYTNNKLKTDEGLELTNELLKKLDERTKINRLDDLSETLKTISANETLIFIIDRKNSEFCKVAMNELRNSASPVHFLLSHQCTDPDASIYNFFFQKGYRVIDTSDGYSEVFINALGSGEAAVAQCDS